jgi:hypothetical protein
MIYDQHGAELRLAGKPLGRIEGGAARLVTDKAGAPRELVGIGEQPQKVTVRFSGKAPRQMVVRANRRTALQEGALH